MMSKLSTWSIGPSGPSGQGGTDRKWKVVQYSALVNFQRIIMQKYVNLENAKEKLSTNMEKP